MTTFNILQGGEKEASLVIMSRQANTFEGWTIARHLTATSPSSGFEEKKMDRDCREFKSLGPV